MIFNLCRRRRSWGTRHRSRISTSLSGSQRRPCSTTSCRTWRRLTPSRPPPAAWWTHPFPTSTSCSSRGSAVGTRRSTGCQTLRVTIKVRLTRKSRCSRPNSGSLWLRNSKYWSLVINDNLNDGDSVTAPPKIEISDESKLPTMWED